MQLHLKLEASAVDQFGNHALRAENKISGVGAKEWHMCHMVAYITAKLPKQIS